MQEWNPQTPTILDRNDTTFCQLCTPQTLYMYLAYSQMNTVLSTAHSTLFYIIDNPYLSCSAAILFHNTYSNITFKHYLPCLVQQLHCTHTYTPRTIRSHAALHTQLPPNTQLTNTKHSWQNGTRCRGWCSVIHIQFVWVLRVPFLHGVVFIH